MKKIILYGILLLLSSSTFAQPETLDYREDMATVIDQGIDGNCLASAVAAMMEWKESGDNVLKNYYSPQFIFDNRQDLNELDISDIERIIKATATRVNTIEELKTSLSENGPCIINFQIYNRTSRMWYPTDSRKIIGMHSMLVVGYNWDGFILRNSWGVNWGDEGYCIFPYSDWKWKWEVVTFKIN